MTPKKTTTKPGPPKADPQALTLTQQSEETRAETLARASLRPTVQAALTVADYNKGFGELSFNSLIEQLKKQCEIVTGGDMSRAESMLTAQAHTLDAIFNSLARRAAMNMGEYMGAAETYLRLGLKAQAQCRATLEALVAIKHPQPVAFVRQANIAHGPQQVNNGAAPSAASAKNPEIPQNEVLEDRHGERLDPAAARPASVPDSSMETVGAVNRTTHPGG